MIQNGTERRILVEGPHLVEHGTLAEISAGHRQTLKRNEQRYRRMAEDWIEVDGQSARTERERMLAVDNRGWGDPVTPESVIDLAREYLARKDERGIMWTLAQERGVDRRTIRRKLEQAEEMSYLPAGTLPRQS